MSTIVARFEARRITALLASTIFVACVVCTIGCSSDGTSEGWEVGENNESGRDDGAEEGSPCVLTVDCQSGLECRNTASEGDERECYPDYCQCEDDEWCSNDGSCVTGDTCDSDDDCPDGENCVDDTGSCGVECDDTRDCDGRLECMDEPNEQGDYSGVCGASGCLCKDERDICSGADCVRAGINCTLENCPDGYGCVNGECICLGLEECHRQCEEASECLVSYRTRTCSQNGYCETQYCFDDSDCRGNRICGMSRVERTCVTVGTGSIGEECRSESDCVTGACVERTCVQSCSANADCPNSQECVVTSDGTFCREEVCGGCSEDEACVGGECGHLCSATGDCAEGEVCAPHGMNSRDVFVCEAGPCLAGPGSEAEQCGAEEICFDDYGNGCELPCSSNTECIERDGCDNCGLSFGPSRCENRRCKSE